MGSVGDIELANAADPFSTETDRALDAIAQAAQAQNQVTVNVNVIYDRNANDGNGLSDKQKAAFQSGILKSAVGEYGSAGVKLNVTYTPGSLDDSNLSNAKISGAKKGAVNVIVSDHVPGTTDSAASKTLNGVAYSFLNINAASKGDLGHELAHVFLGHTKSIPNNEIARFAKNAVNDVSVGISRLIFTGRLREGARAFGQE